MTKILGKYLGLSKRILSSSRSKANLAGFTYFQFLLLGPVFGALILSAPVYLWLVRGITKTDLLVFNLDALGHYLMEFFGFLSRPPENGETKYVRIYFLRKRASTRANHYLLSILERLPAASKISFLPVGPLLWVVLAVVAEMAGPGGSRLIQAMHPLHSRYQGLKREEIQNVIPKEEKDRFETYMDSWLPTWRNGYCVLGIRDSAYYGDFYSQRNSPPELYVPAIEMLLSRGISVVRMGRIVSQAFPLTDDRFLDYGFLGHSDDYLDVMLWIHASFAIGDSTGLTDAVALLGGKTFCATYPMDPRSFLPSANYFFALQDLRELETGKSLKLVEIIELMNQGWNIGDEKQLSKRGYTASPLSGKEIATATEWFLDEISLEANRCSFSNAQKIMIETLSRTDLGVLSHYRNDSLSGKNWTEMRSKIYPGSLLKIL